jgi:hypothetical protein
MLGACAKPQVVQKPPPVTFVIAPSRDVSASSMGMMEEMLSGYDFVAVNRVLLPSIFEGIEIPPAGPLKPEMASQISQRSRAQVLITLVLHKNNDPAAYLNGVFNLQMRLIDLSDGKVFVSRTKALYFMPRGTEAKELMKACLDVYRAAHLPPQ